MRSKTSCFNSIIFKKNITHFWPIWVLYTLVWIFLVPLQLFLSSSYTNVTATAEQIVEMRTEVFIYRIGIATNAYLCFAMAVGAAMAVFGYLYSTRSAHAYHSFPVRREELFITNYISGFLFYTVPLAISFFLGVVVCALRGITSLEYMLAWFLLAEGMTFFFYNMTLVVGMFTGILFAVPIFSLLANYIYIGCRSVIISVLGIIGYGLSDLYTGRMTSIFSPLAFLESKVKITSEWANDGTLYHVEGCKYVAIYAAAGVVFGVLAFLMYRRRRIEATGDLCTFPAIKPVIRWCIAAFGSLFLSVALCSLMPEETKADQLFWLIILCSLFTGIILFFVGEMILQKKTKVFGKKRLIECGVYSVMMLLFIFGMESDAFRLERSLPEADNIASASLQMYYAVYQTDLADIEEILAIHQEIIDSKETFEHLEKEDESSKVTFQYKLNDGTPVYRSYQIPIVREDIMAKQPSDTVAGRITTLSRNPQNYVKGNICLNIDETTVKSMSIDVYDNNLEYRSVDINATDAKQLLAAIREDASTGALLMGYNAEEAAYDEYAYWNSVIISLYCKTGVRTVWTELYDETYISDTDATGIALNKYCTNIIRVLREIGAVNDTDRRLLTISEYNSEADQKQD